MKTRWLLIAVNVCWMAFAAVAADWPQWRGPERNGLSKETGLLQEWPKEGPKLLWHVKDIGDGYSTPSVVGDWLYVLSNTGKDNEFVQSRQVKDGKVGWTTKLGKVGPNMGPQYPGSRSTPTVDGDRVYALGSDGDLVCVKLADGAEVWRKNLRTDFAGKPGQWAYSESVLIDGDVLACTPGGAEATLLALDKKNGAVIWKAALSDADKAAYASITIVNVGGIKQYVQFLEKGVVGVDAKTGKQLWRYNKTASGPGLANIPTPVSRDSYIYSSSQFGGCGLIKLKVEKDEFTPEQIYYQKNLPFSIGGAILLGDNLYGTNSKGLMCIEFTTGKDKSRAIRALAPGLSVMPIIASICTAKTGKLFSSRPRPMPTVRKAASRRRTSPSVATAKPGHIRSSPTPGSTCATRNRFGATTSKPRSNRTSSSSPQRQQGNLTLARSVSEGVPCRVSSRSSLTLRASVACRNGDDFTACNFKLALRALSSRSHRSAWAVCHIS